jgi:hypothetical protein
MWSACAASGDTGTDSTTTITTAIDRRTDYRAI